MKAAFASTALADLSANVFSVDQRRVLKAAFMSIVVGLDDVLLLKGKRVSAEATIVSSLELVLDCPFKPKSVLILSAIQDTTTYATPTLTWVWSSTPSGGVVLIADPLGLLATGLTTFDIFMEKN